MKTTVPVDISLFPRCFPLRNGFVWRFGCQLVAGPEGELRLGGVPFFPHPPARSAPRSAPFPPPQPCLRKVSACPLYARVSCALPARNPRQNGPKAAAAGCFQSPAAQSAGSSRIPRARGSPLRESPRSRLLLRLCVFSPLNSALIRSSVRVDLAFGSVEIKDPETAPTEYISLTTHGDAFGADPVPINWGAEDPGTTSPRLRFALFSPLCCVATAFREVANECCPFEWL